MGWVSAQLHLWFAAWWGQSVTPQRPGDVRWHRGWVLIWGLTATPYPMGSVRPLCDLSQSVSLPQALIPHQQEERVSPGQGIPAQPDCWDSMDAPSTNTDYQAHRRLNPSESPGESLGGQ